jgi:DNA-binding CsgD family transcriptional regulator
VIRSTDIAWLTGLVEGEGTLLMSGRSIAVMVRMTDYDVVERAASLMSGHIHDVPVVGHRKPVWRAQVKGPRAAGWMMTMYSWLGLRRRDQVRRALARWRQMSYVRISPLIERAIREAWAAGEASKVALARQFGVSRETVSRLLERSGNKVIMESSFPAVTMIDIAWLAGLVEGEGNIGINGRSFTIRIKMTDHDVILRAANLLGGKVYPSPVPENRRPQWLTQIKGAAAAGWAMTLYPWLGVRRRQQVRDAIAHWRSQGNGVINGALADAIVTYRAARVSQAEIMRLLKVGKSTVYRHTRGRLPRMRVLKRNVTQTPTSSVDPDRTLPV